MSRYLHLPIYVKTYEFIKILYRMVGQFRKEYKYTLGADLQRIIWEMIDRIIQANSLPNYKKGESIDKISYLFDQFKIRFRLAFDLSLIGARGFSGAQVKLEEIGSMIGGWKKWQKNNSVNLNL